MISRREFIVTTSCPITNNTAASVEVDSSTITLTAVPERLTNDAAAIRSRQPGRCAAIGIAVARADEVARRARCRWNCSASAWSVARRRRHARRRPRSLPASRVAAVARRGRVDGCLRVPVPRVVVRRRRAVRARAVVRPPARPVPSKAHLATVHVDRALRLVWLCLDEPVRRIPEIPEESDPTFRRINNPVEMLAHVGDAHDRQLRGHHALPVGAHRHVRPARRTRSCRRSSSNGSTTSSTATATRSRSTIPTRRRRPRAARPPRCSPARMTTGFNLPFPCAPTSSYETGLEHIMLLCSTPIDDVTSYFTFVVWRNDDFSVLGRGGDRVRPGDRRGGQGDARAGPRRAARSSSPARSRRRPTRPRSSGAAASPRSSRTASPPDPRFRPAAALPERKCEPERFGERRLLACPAAAVRHRQASSPVWPDEHRGRV